MSLFVVLYPMIYIKSENMDAKIISVQLFEK